MTTPSGWMLAQTFAFPLLVAVILFAAAGRLDLPLYWVYIAVVAAFSVGGLFLIGEDLARERMRPGGKPPPWSLRLAFLLCLLYWAIAGLDRGRFHWSDTVPPVLRLVALAVFVLGLALTLWPMYVNPFFSSAVRIQNERGQRVVTDDPYRWVRHPGYAGAIPVMIAGGLVLCSWIAAGLGAAGALWLVRRTVVEDRMLQTELPGYEDYARQVRWRLLPGIW
jgi:protein-S-isoprenylcysteine O-methyltransferase Ste14